MNGPIIEILTPQPADYESFTSDHTKNYQLVNMAASKTLYNRNLAGNKHTFTPGDNIQILSVGITIQSPFNWYWGNDITPDPTMSLFYQVGANQFDLTQFGSQGTLSIDSPNYEFSIGTYIDFSALKAPFELNFKINNVYIFNLGSPTAWDGMTYNVVPFVKILHNVALS